MKCFFILFGGDNMPDIESMSIQEVIDFLKNKDFKASMTANSIFIEKHLKNFGINPFCPVCGSQKGVLNGYNKSGVTQYKCECGKRYTALTNTIFEGTDYTWEEMVRAVHMVINKESVDYIAQNLRSTPLKTASAWLLHNKILYILAKMPTPKLGGVIQIDEKYFRENQKGSHDLISFLDGTSPRKARRHNYRSECGIFGPKFVNVLCAVDNAGHHFAECVCLGPMSEIELSTIDKHLDQVSYICSDNYEAYSIWCKTRNFKHYVEPSTYRKERKARGYIDTDNIYGELTERDYAKDREINEQLYKEGRYPHIENTNRKIDYDEFIALRYKFGLTINRVNSFHAQLERDLVKVKTGVSSNYLPMYIKAYTYLMNYRSEHDKSNLTLKDAESILVQMCLLTLSNKSSPKTADINNMNISDLPRPTSRVIKKAREEMQKVRKIVNVETLDPRDQSAYEGDDTTAQYLFNKRKFFNDIGTVRLNELIKQYGLYRKGQHKREKIDRLCTLPNVQDIIFYEVYLHNYGSIDEFSKAIQQVPQKRKRGRPKKI